MTIEARKLIVEGLIARLVERAETASDEGVTQK